MKRIFAVAAAAATLVAIPSAVAAAGTLSCTFNSSNHQITVTMTGSTSAVVARDGAGIVTVSGLTCVPNGATKPTVHNVDFILVTGDASSQSLWLMLANGGFKPGFTNEPGKSDEIEITVNLGGGTDALYIDGTANVDKIYLGQNNTEFGIIQRINLNGAETTTIDSDVSMINVEKVYVNGEGGADVINGRGIHGTGPLPFGIPTEIDGGPGADSIKGGDATDKIIGGTGKDKLWGYGTGDSFRMDDGAAGDVAHGGDGVDDAIMDPGDTFYQDGR